jgi:hypothetical protein
MTTCRSLSWAFRRHGIGTTGQLQIRWTPTDTARRWAPPYHRGRASRSLSPRVSAEPAASLILAWLPTLDPTKGRPGGDQGCGDTNKRERRNRQSRIALEQPGCEKKACSKRSQLDSPVRFPDGSKDASDRCSDAVGRRWAGHSPMVPCAAHRRSISTLSGVTCLRQTFGRAAASHAARHVSVLLTATFVDKTTFALRSAQSALHDPHLACATGEP